jgi:UDP:flavonoid glycosyltransferase YjiC (YdhE family)
VRLTIVTYGSEGDTRPLVALGRGLLDAGHDVHLFVESSTIGSAHALGVPVEALPGDIKATLPLHQPLRELRTSDLVTAFRDGLRVVNGNAVAWMRTVADHARSSDLILFAGLASLLGETVARALQKPAIGLWLQPATPTREFPCWTLHPHPLTLPRWMNRSTYRVSPQAIIRRLYGRSTDAARREIFGTRNRGGPAPQFPILYGFSRHLVRRPDDWPDTHRVCGHWPLPPYPWQAPDDLLEFLSRGPPPIYVGFGAVAAVIRRRRLHEIIAAVAGRRALFFPGWSDIDAGMLPGNFFVLGNTPHAWLFPHTCMVIHHGGAGTSHTAARAGVPSIPLPVAVDQFFWAGRLAAVGVAPPFVRATRIDARSLGRMIEFAERDSVRERARELGVAMAAEDGVACAVRAIESPVYRTHGADGGFSAVHL